MTDFIRFGRGSGRAKDPRRLVIVNHGYGSNWPSQRKKCLERDNYTCQKCGYEGKKNRRGYWDVHCHHRRKIAWFVDTAAKSIDYDAANDLDNLITLCAYGCHKWADGHQNKSGFTMLR